MRLLSPQPGLAIGPILFIVALMGVIVAALASGTGTFNANANADRIKADLRGQADLIRAKVQECYMATMGNPTVDYPEGPAPSGLLVENLECPGDPTGRQNLWSGKRPASLPPIPRGFEEWNYFNYADGRCIMTRPTNTPGQDVKDALATTAKFFAPTEVYLNTGGNYSFSIWLTPLAMTKVCGT